MIQLIHKVGSAVTKLGPTLISGTDQMAADLGSIEWHKVATAALRHSWSSLVVVPADRRTPSLRPAVALTQALRLHRTVPVTLLDGCGVMATTLESILTQVNATGNGKLIVCVDSFFVNPAAIPLALAAQAVLLCVTLEQTDVASASETLQLVHEKVIGCVVLRPR